jgi:hypothetical protein
VCDHEPTRRAFLGRLGRVAGVAAGLTAAGSAGRLASARIAEVPRTRVSAVPLAPGLLVHPRADWGADLPPRAAMGAEDARFLLVHHTASPNGQDPRQVIRVAYAYHTSAEKGWPDVCYNFLIGHDGSVWEGRAGSLAGPVVADATGGNQGFSQLVCLIGNFERSAPTAAAQSSLTRLLAYLAERDGIDTAPGATTSFVSRGSNKLPAGMRVTTATIAGHRDCSYTACPGDAAYALLPTWRRQAHALRPAPNPYGYARAQRLGVVDD